MATITALGRSARRHSIPHLSWPLSIGCHNRRRKTLVDLWGEYPIDTASRPCLFSRVTETRRSIPLGPLRCRGAGCPSRSRFAGMRKRPPWVSGTRHWYCLPPDLIEIRRGVAIAGVLRERAPEGSHAARVLAGSGPPSRSIASVEVLVSPDRDREAPMGVTGSTTERRTVKPTDCGATRKGAGAVLRTPFFQRTAISSYLTPCSATLDLGLDDTWGVAIRRENQRREAPDGSVNEPVGGAHDNRPHIDSVWGHIGKRRESRRPKLTRGPGWPVARCADHQGRPPLETRAGATDRSQGDDEAEHNRSDRQHLAIAVGPIGLWGAGSNSAGSRSASRGMTWRRSVGSRVSCHSRNPVPKYRLGSPSRRGPTESTLFGRSDCSTKNIHSSPTSSSFPHQRQLHFPIGLVFDPFF